ncbi:hypothetical protein O181_091656 [Austropuccinia psidii MF-1]|uniref:Uncharacterized protein n=1 Tax=Austropuccinia psidii MF-1 TaxID=1389203 RepID=A0A9Q3IXY7_9BASI|nr:hypothetical protein [Austropuccinia psidii MF-1]
MQATIQSNKMDLDKEEQIPGPDLTGLDQERHIWRMPDFPPFPRSVPKTFEIDTEPELIQVNVFRVETIPSGSHRNIGQWISLSWKDKVNNISTGLKNQSLFSIPEEGTGNYLSLVKIRTSSVNQAQKISRTS